VLHITYPLYDSRRQAMPIRERAQASRLVPLPASNRNVPIAKKDGIVRVCCTQLGTKQLRNLDVGD